ncbi:MAG: VOC family protein [Spirochaetales bacterium]|nr:VOC family protein [Spirochaetales bacterium]MBP7262652.1 VOC family protein [Spirochaetia bacterium]
MGFCWVTLNVSDLDASLAFYTKLVGLELDRRFEPVPGTSIAFVGKGGTQVELIRNNNNPDPVHGKDVSLGFTVASLEDKLSDLKGAYSGPVLGPFEPGPGIRFIYIEDPDGTRIQFVEERRPADSR